MNNSNLDIFNKRIQNDTNSTMDFRTLICQLYDSAIKHYHIKLDTTLADNTARYCRLVGMKTAVLALGVTKATYDQIDNMAKTQACVDIQNCDS